MKTALAAAVLAAAMMAAAAGVAVSAPRATSTAVIWESLFPPPYTACPEIVVGLSCIAKDLCFIPGGSNGAGFGMFTFDGQPNGQLLPMAEPNQTTMILTTAMGGTKQQPVGAFGGAGGALLDMTPPIQYLANGTTWEPSLIEQIEFVLETQSMCATDDGQHILFVGNGIQGSSVMHSEDAGVLFEVVDVNTKLPRPKNCSAPAYAAMVNETTWYLTAGQFPQDRKNSGRGARDRDGNRVLARKNFHIDIVEDKATKRARYSVRESKFGGGGGGDDYVCVGYVAIIAKTTDGGQTFTVQYANDNATFAFSQIDCASAVHCVAVGAGDTAGAETVIFQTTDGQHWRQVLSVPNTPTTMHLLYSIRFADAQHVWAAGGLQTQTASAGLLFFSNDGGSTWEQYPHLQPDIYEIMDLSFAEGVGYAAAMSEFKTATILKYANQPYFGYFTQAQCPTSGCNFLCENITFPQGMCLTAQGGSAMAFCTAAGLEQRMYETTSCVGNYTTTTQPVGQCLATSSGGFFENFCGGGSGQRSFGRQRPLRL